MGAERVILTRALRDAEAPTVASRWLMRLENLLRGLGPEGQAALEASRDRGAAWLAMAPLVDLPDTPATPARRPEPRPPVEARPDGLSVTQIETLVRDPYAIYARKVLGLRPLEPVGRKSDAMARGSAIHSALETFVRENMDALPEDAETAYFAALRSALHEAAPSSAVRAWWTARLGRASEWFLEGERERRLRGRPVALEVKGERPLTGLHRTFRVTAKADRIDAANDGRYGFYDYKSGNVPSEKEVKAFHLQLPLEAAIAEAGGFDGLPAAGAFRLELIGLGAQATRRVDADPHAVAVTWARLHKLIRYYLDPANGFTARLRPQKISFESEYDHLSRKGEWSDGEPPEGEHVNAATEAQVRAARPGESSWVSANAGSGKTRVLTDRVARLLLSGADPQKVLCLTYTKAAAAEMQNRLFRTLGAWAMLPDDDLRAALDALGEPGATLPETRLDLARTLFARALETPGGLKIQTIHAFCDSLLRRFPLEAGVAPQFAVLEDRQARALREDVLEDIAEREPAVVESLARHFTGDEPDRLLEDVGRHREAFARDFDAEALAAAFGIDPDLSVEDLHDAVMSPGTEDLLAALVPVLGASGPNDVKAAAKIAAALTASDADTRLVLLESVLLTHGGQAPFTAKIGTLPTKAVRASHPILTEGLEALMTRVEAGAAEAARDRSARAFRRAAWFRPVVSRGIRPAQTGAGPARFRRPDRARGAAARSSRDRGLGPLAAGRRARPHPGRRGAGHEPGAMEGRPGDLGRVFRGGGRADDRPYHFRRRRRETVDLQLSRRGPGGLRGHEGAFRRDDRRARARSFSAATCCIPSARRHRFSRWSTLFFPVRPVLASPPASATARSIRPCPAGWSSGRFSRKPDAPDESAWDDPVDAPPPDDPVAELAGGIAARIAGWLADGTLLPRKDGDRPIRAGDVMILVQRRGPLFHAVIRALKQAAVPVAGADVLRVGAELAVKDLLAALRVAATPGDDLSLAALLRSPLGGLTETELFDLAHGRDGNLVAGAAGRADGAMPTCPRSRVRSDGPGGFPAAVRTARTRADPARRAAASGGAAGPGGGGRHRRAPRPGAGLRERRGTERDGVPRLDRP